MNAAAVYAAIGTAAASAIGAAAICLLVSRQGFAPPTVEPVDAAIRRHLAARLTYFVVGACLAINALLGLLAFTSGSTLASVCAGTSLEAPSPAAGSLSAGRRAEGG